MKKSMKKNALVSAIAMLIVSAIVLTSATYAWFSASTQATVAELGSSVQTASGLLVSLDGTTWKANISASDLAAAGVTSPQLAPVSTTNGTTFVGGAFDDTDNLVLATATTGFYNFDLYVKSGATATVSLASTVFDASTDVKKALKFALYDVDSSTLGTGIVSADGVTTSYKGISTAGSYASNGTAIVDTGTALTPITIANAEIILAANTPKHYKVLVWLEGNDPDCTEALAGLATSFSLAFTLA